MLQSYRWKTLLTAAVGCCFLAEAAVFVAPEVRDDGKFFTAAAIKKADDRIREIYRKHGRDVLVETIATVPAADAENVKALDADKRAAYFLKTAKARTQTRAVNGIYVLICKEPRHLLVGVEESQPNKFAPATRNAIENAIRQEFKENRFDEGLDQALRIIETQLAKK